LFFCSCHFTLYAVTLYTLRRVVYQTSKALQIELIQLINDHILYAK